MYFYDSCNLTQVLETTLNTEPAGKVQDSEFWIARVVNNGGTVTIEDKRAEYWEYYIKGVSDKLTKTNNLSDLTDVAEARNNLDVYSKEEVDVLVSTDTVGWTSMNRANAAQNTGFDLKACRVGKTISISGRFKPAANVNGSDIATLSLSTIADGLSLTNRIWSQSNEISGGSTNYGITFYVETFDPDTQPVLKLVCDTNYGGELFGIQYAFVNMTFLAV